MRATRCSFYGPLGPLATRLSIVVACGSREESTRGGSVARSGDQLLSSRCAIGRRRLLARLFVRSFVRVASFSFLSLLSSLHSSLLFSSLSSHPSFFSLFPIYFLDVLVSPNAACCACVREPKFAQRGYGYITRQRPSVQWPTHNYAATSRRATTAFVVYVIAAVASRQISCMHIHQYIRRNTCTYRKRTVHTSTYPNTHWRICSCTRTDIKVYVPGPARRSLGVRFSSHVHAKPRQRQNGERASERAGERTSVRTSQPAAVARHGCALLTYTPVLLFVSLLPTGPSFSHDRGLAI